MRSIVRVGTPLLAAALLLAGCGGSTGGNDGESATATGGDSGGGGGSEQCSVKLGFFGALTGDAANLGINIRNGAELAVEQFEGDCEVELVDYDSQGDPTQAPGLAKSAIDDEDVIGIIGPAFSGESEVAHPPFAEAGLPAISASATNPELSQNGWETFFRVLGNDATQGPAAASYISDTLGAESVFVIDDASAYGKGLADIVIEDLGDAVVGTDTIQQKQTDFSATVTKIRAVDPDVVFFGGYYAEAGLLISQIRDAGLTPTFVVGDGVKDDGFLTAAGEAAEGTVITCPCLPPDQAEGTFAEDYEAEYGTVPATYSAEAYDATSIFLAGIEAGATTREEMLEFVQGFEGDGVTKQLAFDENGEPAEVSVWAYTVQDGAIVPDQEIRQE